MNSDNLGSRDISVLQLLTRLVVETEKLIRLADDINQYASTPQAKTSLGLISTEVKSVLTLFKTSIDPLYNLYEIDPGMKSAKVQSIANGENNPLPEAKQSEYDENSLWTDVKNKNT